MIEEYKKEGKLVPSEIVATVLEKAMKKSKTNKFLVDGFPRNQENLATAENIVCFSFYRCRDTTTWRSWWVKRAGCHPNQPGVSLENAVSFNGNLIKHVNSGKRTPQMPNRTFETYIFSLFNENLKPTVSEQNYGLFKPDLTPVYDVGILRTEQAF
ncbi:hypothetical protein L6164_036889 [Bauhinia variegata]|uniref:Uncharacterized protein n=1 Tax=Bauhinia variegata TaxID=167791 RepID=A0ACB9KIE2_BAUVA|nr:hypothetical protein L6164_036889 [Bauhinia variegata]